MDLFATEVAVNITLTDKAAQKVAQLVEQRGDASMMLRVSVAGGGCSGFSYAFDIDNSEADEDTVIEHNGVKLVVDGVSVQYLRGSEVDFVEGLQGSQFVVRNPNAASTCGCGTSFSI